VQAGQVDEVFLYHPVDAGLGKLAMEIAEYRQVVDDIAQGRCFDEENAHG